MNPIRSTILLLFLTNAIYAQDNKGICKIEVSDVSVLNAFGYLNYSVEFTNRSGKTVDGIYWTAYFYNNAGDLISTEKSEFNSGGMVDPIATGFKKIFPRMPKVKGASKAYVVINKVHFSDIGNCP